METEKTALLSADRVKKRTKLHTLSFNGDSSSPGVVNTGTGWSSRLYIGNGDLRGPTLQKPSAEMSTGPSAAQ